jgi:hypothetical protein
MQKLLVEMKSYNYPKLSKSQGSSIDFEFNFLKDDRDFIFRTEDEVYLYITINHSNYVSGGLIDSPVKRFKGTINYLGYATFNVTSDELQIFEEGTQLAEVEIHYASEIDCDNRATLTTKGKYPHQGYFAVEVTN